MDQTVKKLREFFQQHRRLPSYQEICTLFGFASKNAAFTLAQKLIKDGIVEKDPTGRLIPKNLFPPLPVLGTIRAGSPTSAEHQILDTLSITSYLVDKPEQSYVLRVSGDSMIDAGIYPEDLVILEKGKEPREGDIVAAHIDGEFTLKYFRKANGSIQLVPANKKYHPFIPKETLEIFGIVVSVIRKYH